MTICISFYFVISYRFVPYRIVSYRIVSYTPLRICITIYSYCKIFSSRRNYVFCISFYFSLSYRIGLWRVNSVLTGVDKIHWQQFVYLRVIKAYCETIFGLNNSCIRSCFSLHCKLVHAVPTNIIMYLTTTQRSSSRYGWWEKRVDNYC